jgi:uncharacterized protein YjiS (DUF1127 family)
VNTVTLTRYPQHTPTGQNSLLVATMSVARRIRRHIQARSDRKLLQSMPDYILADIGVSRGGIDRAVTYGRLHDGRR